MTRTPDQKRRRENRHGITPAVEEGSREAAADPDNPPLSDEDFARMKRVPRARTIRRALGLTQEEFASRFRIPVGTLRDWEQGRAEPDQAARAYLTVIAREPEAVRKALRPRFARAT
ncbi:MAG: helix-turn-helix domain-containing protein [Pararhizobium sp.]